MALLGKEVSFTGDDDEARYRITGIADTGQNVVLVMKNISEVVTFYDRRITVSHEYYEQLDKQSNGKGSLIVSVKNV